MLNLLPRVLLALIFWGMFTYVIFNVDYPKSITQANFFQLLSFFVPLFLSLIFSINIPVKNVFASTSISLGIIFLLLMKALDILNLVSFALTVIAVGLFLSYFKKTKRNRDLTSTSRIPKLSMKRKVK